MRIFFLFLFMPFLMFLCEGTDTIYPGKCLYSSRNQDNYLKSPNGQYRVYMQGNGDVVLYKCVDGYQPLWKSNTRKNYPAEPYRLCMDRNDKLVAYDRYDRKVWDNQVGSKNGWASGGRAKIRNDGNFVVYDKNWKTMWHSGTRGGKQSSSYGTGYVGQRTYNYYFNQIYQSNFQIFFNLFLS